MSNLNGASDFLDEIEEERIIREYQEECAAKNEVLNIKKLNLNGDQSTSTQINDNEKIDKCLNISDNEYLENLSLLDTESSDKHYHKTNQPLYIDTSIPQFVLDNLNKVAQIKMKSKNYLTKEIDYNELNSSTSTLNSSQLNGLNDEDLIENSTTTKSTHSNLLNKSNGTSLSNINHSKNLSSNDNLLQNDDSSINNFKRKKRASIITFELISARSVHSIERSASLINSTNLNSKPFILYTIIIKRIPGLETQPGIIEKRYSDFYRFFLSLRKSFPLFIQGFTFPKKTFSNNFDADVIAARSFFFGNFLNYCLSVQEIRKSLVFYEFVLHNEFTKCRRLLRTAKFEEAIICLENLLFILTKLNQIETLRYLQLNIFTTHLALAACLNEIEKFTESSYYADETFKMISFNNNFDTNELIIPFLLLSVQLNSRLSRCCKAQNQKLLELYDAGITYDKKECLIDLFVHKNYFILTP